MNSSQLSTLSSKLSRLPSREAVKAEIARREAVRLAEHADEIRTRCRTLAGFVREAWHVLEPDHPCVWSWHMDAICEHLEAVSRGEITRLLMNIWPGASKSLIVSVMWQAFEWGPMGLRSHRFLTTSFSEVATKRDTRKTRDLIRSAWFQTLWPMKLVREGETSFANSATGTREGVPFGSVTNQRADRFILDDPHSTKTVESEAERNNTTRQFREGALNRLNDQAKSAIVVIMQRLHAADISGVILSLKMGYSHLCLPMEFEADRRCETVIGFRDPRSYDGELADPMRFPAEEVAKLKAEMGYYAFAGQYQQRPTPREGGLFKRVWFTVVDARPVGGKRVRSWDLAATRKTGSNNPDWTVGTLICCDLDGRFIVEDVVRFRGTPFEVEKAILATASADGPLVIVRLSTDAGQAGVAQVDYLTLRLAGHIVTSERETGSKEIRAMPFASQCEAGNVRVLRGAWNDAWFGEVELFPAGQHDDQVDSAANGFNWLTSGQRPDNSGFLEFYRDQARATSSQ